MKHHIELKLVIYAPTAFMSGGRGDCCGIIGYCQPLDSFSYWQQKQKY